MAVVTVSTYVGTKHTYTVVDSQSGVLPLTDYSTANRWTVQIDAVARPVGHRKYYRAFHQFARDIRKYERGIK